MHFYLDSALSGGQRCLADSAESKMKAVGKAHSIQLSAVSDSAESTALSLEDFSYSTYYCIQLPLLTIQHRHTHKINAVFDEFKYKTFIFQ